MIKSDKTQYFAMEGLLPRSLSDMELKLISEMFESQAWGVWVELKRLMAKEHCGNAVNLNITSDQRHEAAIRLDECKVDLEIARKIAAELMDAPPVGARDGREQDIDIHDITP